MRFFDRAAALTSGMLLCLILGCGGGATGPKVPDGAKGFAKAKVTFNGKPIDVGTLLLDSGKGYTASAPVGNDGTFQLKGPNGAEIPAGTYKVGITPPPAPPPDPSAGKMRGPPKIEGLPEKFYNPSSSGVKVEIREGRQDIEIILK